MYSINQSSISDVPPFHYVTVPVNTTTEVKDLLQQHSLNSDPVRHEVLSVFAFAFYFLICGCGSVFGIAANTLNIIVFLRQGFKDSINISLFGLAISDLVSLVTMCWSSICSNESFSNSGLPFDSSGVMYYTGGLPHGCFNRVTSFITAFITMERCLCITLPLKVKNIITPLRTKMIIICIFIVNFILFSPFYFVNKLEWMFNNNLNRTILSLIYTRDRERVETVTFPIHSVGLSAVSMCTVVICTSVLVIDLNKKTKWRSTSVAQTSKPETSSTKDKKVVKMITFIAFIFTICNIPSTTLFFWMAYDPRFSFNGQLANLFFVLWAVSFSLEMFNSSVNILIYFKMSSKFRVTLVDMFCVRDSK